MSLFWTPDAPSRQKPKNDGFWWKLVPNPEHFPKWSKITVVTVCLGVAVLFFSITDRDLDRLRLEIAELRRHHSAEIREVRAEFRAERAERILAMENREKKMETLRKNLAWDLLMADKDLRAGGLRSRDAELPVSVGDLSLVTTEKENPP